MSKGEKVGKEPKREEVYRGSSRVKNTPMCLCHRQASTNFPTSFRFLFLHLQILFLYSALCIMLSNKLVVGFYSLPCHFISNNFYSCDAIHFHQSLIWLVRICQNLELMSLSPFLIGNHKTINFL